MITFNEKWKLSSAWDDGLKLQKKEKTVLIKCVVYRVSLYSEYLLIGEKRIKEKDIWYISNTQTNTHTSFSTTKEQHELEHPVVAM